MKNFKNLLLNCDLGEWESPETTADLIPHLHLANIACGGHAGSFERINHAALIAKKHGVKCGAHPGVPNNKGRTLPENFTSVHFTQLLKSQIASYLSTDAFLHHLKLHGALYHLSENDEKIRTDLFEFLKTRATTLICLAGGKVASEAADRKIPHLQEAFLDRHYQANGQLLPRDHPDALIHDPEIIADRLQAWQNEKPISAHDGTPLLIKADTLCVHSDSPNALAILKMARAHLED